MIYLLFVWLISYYESFFASLSLICPVRCSTKTGGTHVILHSMPLVSLFHKVETGMKDLGCSFLLIISTQSLKVDSCQKKTPPTTTDFNPPFSLLPFLHPPLHHLSTPAAEKLPGVLGPISPFHCSLSVSWLSSPLPAPPSLPPSRTSWLLFLLNSVRYSECERLMVSGSQQRRHLGSWEQRQAYTATRDAGCDDGPIHQAEYTLTCFNLEMPFGILDIEVSIMYLFIKCLLAFFFINIRYQNDCGRVWVGSLSVLLLSSMSML